MSLADAEEPAIKVFRDTIMDSPQCACETSFVP